MTDVQFKSIDCTEIRYIIFIILESKEKILHLASVWYAVKAIILSESVAVFKMSILHLV